MGRVAATWALVQAVGQNRGIHLVIYEVLGFDPFSYWFVGFTSLAYCMHCASIVFLRCRNMISTRRDPFLRVSWWIISTCIYTS